MGLGGGGYFLKTIATVRSSFWVFGVKPAPKPDQKHFPPPSSCDPSLGGYTTSILANAKATVVAKGKPKTHRPQWKNPGKSRKSILKG